MQTRHDPLKTAAPVAAAEPKTSNPQPTAARSGGLKKVSLGGIAKKKEDTSNKYPVYPDEDGRAAEIAARIAERQEQWEALDSAIETDKAELGRILIRPWYFQHFHRRTDVPSSVLVNYTIPADPSTPGSAARTGAVRVTVKE